MHTPSLPRKSLLRPGGVLLNGDHLREDEAVAPTLARLGPALTEREERHRAPDGRSETWTAWWEQRGDNRLLCAVR